MQQQRWYAASFAAVERDVMIGAYAVRKLLEAETVVPHSIRDRTLHATAFPTRSCPDDSGPDLLNWQHLNRWFDFDDGVSTRLTPRDVCNQIIHSWIFAPVVDDTTKGLDAIMVSSDRERRRRLYSIAIAEVVGLFIAVGESEVTSLRMSRDSTGQCVVKQASEH